MACASCQQHRAKIVAAVKSGSVSATVKAAAQATAALGENAGRRLIRPKDPK